jgi:hypothetical protein
MQALTGEANPDMSDPTKLPDRLDTRPLMGTTKTNHLRVPGYQDKFYGQPGDRFTILPPDVDRSLKSHVSSSTDEKWKKEKSLTSSDMYKVEKSLRRCMCITSSVDVLLDAIQTVTDSAGLSDNEKLKELYSALSRSVAHLAAHSAQGTATAMLFRRDAFLKAASNRIPKAIHDWLLCQPIISKEDHTTSLFGNVAGKVREFKQQEDKAAANISLSKLKPSQAVNNQKNKSNENKKPMNKLGGSGGYKGSGDYRGTSNKYKGQFRGGFSSAGASRGRRH